ncbi:hypothetical protein [Acidovorax sp. JHL-9]|uniref:hypothetical protein n=1 Tax=Acidovorax sp. JHL-9 TaxID=1276756 RepID=UPI001EE15C16|nr:hypothetical protein [Acidovorax sp. JHL-9]
MSTPPTLQHTSRNDGRKGFISLLLLTTLSACGGGSDSATLGVETAQASESAATPGTVTNPETAPALPPAPTLIAKAPFSCAAGAITCVEVASTSSQAQASLPITFGQPFKAGDWLHTAQGLVAQVGGATIPLQADEISSHRDGSARFAVLSAQLSNVQPGEARIINIFSGAKTSSPPSVPASPDWNLELEAQVYDANGNVTATLVAQPQAQLATQIANNTDRRLAGAVASEYTVALPFKDKATGTQHPHLTARLHTRLLDGGQRIRTDVVMENTRTWTESPGNITYSFAVKRNGSTIYTQPKFTHYHHARWHKVLWTGASAEPLARVRHNMPYFMASKAVWNYDLNLTIPETVLSSFYSQYTQAKANQASLGPMANLLMTAYFPTTGGRPEIGPVPQWTAFYLISQDERMKEVMLAHADVAGGVPIHYRDEATSHPLDLDRYPNVSTLRGTSQPALPTVVNGSTTWEADTAHQGSFAYVPYLVTGDAFYLDELSFWAAWNLTAMSPGYRSYGQGLLWEDQVRSHAWTMRALGDAARILPDSHFQKGYFKQRLSNNLEWFYQNWVINPDRTQVPPTNTPISPYGLNITVPWQNDFLAISLSLHAENGEPRALELVKWMSDFGVGRFLAESQGFCLSKAAAYNINLKDANNNFVSGWSALAQLNFPGFNCATPIEYDGYPSWAGGYASNARAMLAATTSISIANARQAYDLWKSKTPSIDTDYQNNPTWAIVPR